MRLNLFPSVLIFMFFFSFTAGIIADKSTVKKMAVTFDDLPAATMTKTEERFRKITDDLLEKIVKYRVPAVGFVNEKKLYKEDVLIEDRVSLLRAWLDEGLELGNHTFSHKNFHKVSLEEFKEDIVKGEKIIKELAGKYEKEIRYFRHPYLRTGTSLELKTELEDFLKNRDYIIAPVTVDNSDWLFSLAYDKALEAADTSMLKQIGEAYIPYMKEKIKHFERQSGKLFGRNISQILLLHANTINSDYFDDLAEMIKSEGYEFATLEEVLKDPAYRSEDKFIKKMGISWLDRWALTQGKKGDFFRGEPATPQEIKDYAGFKYE